jgi:hypothetical protein
MKFISNKVLLQVGVERTKTVKMRSHINYPLSGCYPLRSLSNFWGLFYCHWISNKAKNDNSFFSRLNEIIFSVSWEWITNKIVLATSFFPLVLVVLLRTSVIIESDYKIWHLNWIMSKNERGKYFMSLFPFTALTNA